MKTVKVELADTPTRFASVGISTLSTLKADVSDLMGSINILHSLEGISRITGGYVHLVPELSYIPVLRGADNQPVFLYHLVEVMDEYLDIDQILNEFPNLSYSQVAGAIAFLRKTVQINSQNIDIDDLEDEFESNDPAFLAALEQAFNDKETVRVLYQPE